jgi:hypothetical protein
MSVEFSRRIDLGHVLLFLAMILGSAVAWGRLQAQMDSVHEAMARHIRDNEQWRAEFGTVLKENQRRLQEIREEQIENSTLIREHWGRIGTGNKNDPPEKEKP